MPYIGIDLGTTNSCIVVAHWKEDGAIDKDFLDIKQLKEDNTFYTSKIMPSCIYIRQDGTQLVGEGAKELDKKAYKNEKGSRTLRLFKKQMGLLEPFRWKIDGAEFTPVTASAIVLKKCGEAYNIYGLTHGRLKYQNTPATITCPASFEKSAKEDTQQAAKQAGFSRDIKMLDEPNAALLSYVYNETQKKLLDLSAKKRFVTVDLGGGTCDVVVIDVQEETLPNGKKNLVLRQIGSARRGDLGGSDFDKALAVIIIKKFLHDNHLTVDPKSEEYVKLVSQAFTVAEEVKEEFSNDLRNQIEIALVEQEKEETEELVWEKIKSLPPKHIHIPDLYNGLSVDEDITLEDYLKIVNHLIYKQVDTYTTVEEKKANKNIEEIVFDTLADCQCKPEEIDYVFFTGGMSYFWPLRLALSKMLQKEIKIADNPLTAVAEGAALYTLFKEAQRHNDTTLWQITNEKESLSDAEQQAIRRNKQSVQMRTSIGKTYMLESKDSLPIVLIERNAEYPTPRTRIEQVFTTNSERGAIINIFFGTSRYNWDIELSRSLELTFKKPKKLKTPFYIDYEIDEAGIPVFYAVFGENEVYQIGGTQHD